MHPLARLLKYARGHRADVVLATLYTFVNTVCDILPEVLIGVAVDVVVKREHSWLAGFGLESLQAQVVGLALATAAVWLLESWSQYLYEVKWRNLAQALQHEFRVEAYDHVQHLDMRFFEERRSGELLSVLNDDINQMERFFNTGASELIQVLASSVLVAMIFFALSPAIALLSLLPVPFIIYGAFWFQGRLGPRYARVRDEAGRVNAQIGNNLGGIATIKAFTAEAHETAAVDAASRRYQAANGEAIRFSSAIVPVVRVAIMAGFVATLVYGAFQTLDGRLAVGAYSVLIFLTQRLLWPLTHLAEITDNYNRAIASIRRVMDLLATPVAIESGGQPLPAAQVAGRIEFDNVGFAYGASPVIDAIDLTIPAGATVAFVGETGSGKSTLLKLLLRFHDVGSGRILIDGHELRGLDLHDVRRAIGFVSQDVFLVDGSIADNIRYGSFGADQAAVMRAAQAAEAHGFISALPDGYATTVGERGQKLSGGQRQRIAIARALLKDPPILVLDEATSAVDNETEAAIQASLAAITRGRTTLMVAHRLSTIRHAHCIYVIERGRIAEQGGHDALVAADGIYAGLWRLQTGERGDA